MSKRPPEGLDDIQRAIALGAADGAAKLAGMLRRARTRAQWFIWLFALFAGISFALGFYADHLEDRLRASERLREDILAAAADKIELLEGEVAGKTLEIEEAHLANVQQYENLISCGCTPDRWQRDDFAGSDLDASGTVKHLGGGDVLQPLEKGPIRTEAK